MTKHTLAAFAAAAAFTLSSSAAFSQTANAPNMIVSMTVAAECTLTTDAVAFGPQGLIDADVEVPGNMTVLCTQGAPYRISLSAGLGNNATVANRVMTGTTATHVANYTIHQGATAAGIVWGDTAGTDTLAGVATGGQDVQPFLAVLPAGQSVAADTYTDTLTATITYGTAL